MKRLSMSSTLPSPRHIFTVITLLRKVVAGRIYVKVAGTIKSLHNIFSFPRSSELPIQDFPTANSSVCNDCEISSISELLDLYAAGGTKGAVG
jgi:hypothetical protein